MVNVDDVAGETVPYLFEALMNMGAKNVHAVPALTKKGRQEFIFLIDVSREHLARMGDFLVSELGTLGLRVFEASEHIEFPYQQKECKLVVMDEATGEDAATHVIAVKLISDSRGQLAAVKAEYEDLRSALNFLAALDVRVSLGTLRNLVEIVAWEGQSRMHGNIRVEP
jgi:uncharacterized protein (DUF111 family)